MTAIFVVGRLFINKTVPKSFEEIENKLWFVKRGGWWKPKRCRAKKKTAIIIPYRNRKDNLLTLLRHLLPILRRQYIHFRIFLVEQVDQYPFNKAKLANIGYTEAQQLADFDCVIFHDADFLAADDRNRHDCPTSPRHMSPSCDLFNYKLWSNKYFGGVIAVNKQDMEGKRK